MISKLRSYLSRILNPSTNTQPKPLPMHLNNILIISSSARELNEVCELLVKFNYKYNSEPILLDNGDFARVVAKS